MSGDLIDLGNLRAQMVLDGEAVAEVVVRLARDPVDPEKVTCHHTLWTDEGADDEWVEANVPAALIGAANDLGAAAQYTPEDVAQRFHEAYERLAPAHGYKTRDASAVPWEDVPENNKALMIATCREVLISLGLIPVSTWDPEAP